MGTRIQLAENTSIPPNSEKSSKGSVLLKLIHPVHLRGGGSKEHFCLQKAAQGGVATGAGAALQETVQNTLGGGVGSKEHLA